MKKVVAFVPVKLNNERLPGKNTKAFDDGVPLMSLILNSLLKVRGLDDVYVYCSDEAVNEYLPPGVKYLKRSADLDRSETKINEVLRSFARDIPAAVYLLAHATAPFLSAESIQKGLDRVVSGEHDSALSVYRMQEFVWKDGRPMNYDPSSIPRTQDLAPLHVETTGLYIYERGLILDRNTRIGDRPFLLEVSRLESVDINEPIDFEMANSIYMQILRRGIR